MKYIAAPLNLKEHQFIKLAQGKGISINPKHLTSQSGKGFTRDNVFLTQGQINRLKKSIKSGKNVRLTLSKQQLLHHNLHGEGWFSDKVKNIWGSIKDLGKKAIE